MRSLLLTGVLCGILAATGCGNAPSGPPLTTVSGTVTYDGQPLPSGEIVVRAVDGKHSAGSIITDGKYEVRATAGKKVVEITAMRDVPGKFKEENPGEKTAVREQYIPAKYNTKSELEMDVATGAKKEVPFTLDKK